jgi:integrase
MRVLLTDRFCAGAKAQGKPQADYFDEQEAGLCLRVSSAGRKSWTLHYTSPKDGKRARQTLALYPQTSLAAARGLALEAKAYLDKGVDPRDALNGAVANTMTVASLIPLYIEKPHKRTGKPRKSAKEIRRRFDKNVIPVIGGVRLSDLHRRDVQRTLAPILRRAPIEAARTFEDLRAMIRWAVGQGYLDRNIVEGMESPATSVPRERTLDENEIKTFWNELPAALTRSKSVQRICQLCLVTAQRVGEVAGMRRSELNLKDATWTIPASRSKNGFKHAVSLSPLAVELIKAALADAGPELVFPNPAGTDPLPVTAVAKTIARAHKDGRFKTAQWTTHDLRRSAVSHMAALGVSPIVLGHIINHRSVTKAGVTLSAYQHYDYSREKRQALDFWADRLEAIIDAGTAAVLPMMRKRS